VALQGCSLALSCRRTATTCDNESLLILHCALLCIKIKNQRWCLWRQSTDTTLLMFARLDKRKALRVARLYFQLRRIYFHSRTLFNQCIDTKVLTALWSAFAPVFIFWTSTWTGGRKLCKTRGLPSTSRAAFRTLISLVLLSALFKPYVNWFSTTVPSRNWSTVEEISKFTLHRLQLRQCYSGKSISFTICIRPRMRSVVGKKWSKASLFKNWSKFKSSEVSNEVGHIPTL